MTTVLFYILAGLTAASALAVVVTQNIVRAATWLLFTLGGVAGIFFLLGADFVGATQLLVYVGGTLVLVVFGVMLTAQGPFINMRIGAAEWLIALVAGLMLFGVLALSVAGVQAPPDFQPRDLAPSKQLGAALLGDERATPEAFLPHREGAPEREKRERSRMSYLLPFEIVSVHLLVVLIGAAYLARAKKRIKAEV
jgi:NADH-quinone oxidoreductase subunit J